jgi:pyruvate dehydrogenase E2 component (dihydrolipoamide acetyltransferase)
MARWEFKLPDIGEGVTEGEIVAWCEGIEVGAQIKADQGLAEVMTDKATVTITCPKGGTILELGGPVGHVVQVGQNLVVLEMAGAAQPAGQAAKAAPAQPAPPVAQRPAAAPPVSSAPAASPAPAATPPRPADPTAGAAATAVGDIRETLPGMSRAQPRQTVPSRQQAPAYFTEKPLATPATRKLARDLGVDLRTVAPTGENNRVTRDDVSRAADEAAGAASSGQHASGAGRGGEAAEEHAEPPPRAAQPAGAPAPIRIATPTPAQEALEERTPLKGVRKKIFEQMSRSVHTAAHFTFVEECDVTALKALRARLRPAAEKQGVKLTPLSFIIKAVVAALKKHPELNSAFDESTQEVVRRRYYNIGVASATEAGLMVPVVKDADRRSLLEVAREVQRLGEATKAGKIRIEDLQGSTFTITSLGAQGGLFATPILNFPEVGILGVHQIKEKPVVRGGQIVIGEVMLLSLSFDHRLIDGHIGAAFAYDVIGFLEDPDRLFLEMV